jgi:hypothetical protein
MQILSATFTSQSTMAAAHDIVAVEIQSIPMVTTFSIVSDSTQK